MAAYLSLDAFQELIDSIVSNPASANPNKALANSLLNFHFPITNGYIIVPEHHSPESIILRVQRHQCHSGDRIVIHHTVAKTGQATDDTNASLKQLERALDLSNPDSGRCWALLLHGLELRFYEYHRSLPVDERLVPWGLLASQPPRDSYHARSDNVIIEGMLQYMAKHSTPDPR
ncbi:uncharacterized protein KD926_006346 [Aspergillus affinis]|uniref:uncharacterized protein n=1 Tax=Aspergillus affinis TaxID=1070780 RepID=UPI0022FF1D10|nr:uncharacterized protein KD926_006346 [Aspergillus affinis]KAI9042009.1 hypothetical protein KD926_006346 [Aspergillus affinis]